MSSIYQDAINVKILFIAFCIAMVRYAINEDSTSSLIILEYTPKTSKIKTSLLKAIKLLIALKNISSAKSSLMLGILVMITE